MVVTFRHLIGLGSLLEDEGAVRGHGDGKVEDVTTTCLTGMEDGDEVEDDVD